MKNLPVETQSFSEIIDGKLYVDKTMYIQQLITERKTCFLSRPRRFGKSLLLDTIDEVFRGNRNLFKGLYIGSHGYAFPIHPVIRFSMTEFDPSSPETLKEDIIDSIMEQAENEEITVKGKSHLSCLASLVKRLFVKYQDLSKKSKDPSRKYEPKVVILIDEYDAPITFNIGDLDLAKAIRKVLHGFYASLKNLDSRLRFVFVTGISRFALTAMDSGANNLKDISLNPDYSGICGFTQKELDIYFGDRMEATLEDLIKKGYVAKGSDLGFLRAQIIDWYNGYNWGAGSEVMNPFSIVSFFDEKKFSNFWFESGLPGHLTELVMSHPLDYLQPKLDGYLSTDIRKVDLMRLTPTAILFHSGYLTIDEINWVSDKNDKRKKEEYYSFKLPNYEVSRSYNNYCIDSIFEVTAKEFEDFSEKIYPAFLEQKAPEVATLFTNILSGITYFQHIQEEKYYHSLIHSALSGMGFEVISERLGAIGRSDMVLILPDGVRLIIELKYKRATDSVDESGLKKELSKLIEQAKTSFKSKDYDGPWKLNAKKIIMMSLAIYDRKDVMVEFIDEKTKLSSKKRTPGRRSSRPPKKAE
jgi:hypothetical protein